MIIQEFQCLEEFVCFSEECWNNHSILLHPSRTRFTRCCCHHSLVGHLIPVSSVPHTCTAYDRNEYQYLVLISPVVSFFVSLNKQITLLYVLVKYYNNQNKRICPSFSCAFTKSPDTCAAINDNSPAKTVEATSSDNKTEFTSPFDYSSTLFYLLLSSD